MYGQDDASRAVWDTGPCAGLLIKHAFYDLTRLQ